MGGAHRPHLDFREKNENMIGKKHIAPLITKTFYSAHLHHGPGVLETRIRIGCQMIEHLLYSIRKKLYKEFYSILKIIAMITISGEQI